MRDVLGWLAVLTGPAIALYVLVWVSTRGVPFLLSWRRRRLYPDGVAARPLEQLVADLRRLERQLHQLDGDGVSARAHRLTAVSLAYDDTLVACCKALGLPEPGPRPLTPMGRLEAQADLAQHGLTW